MIDKKALVKTLYWGLAAVAIGLLYYVFIRITGFGLPCMIKETTGFDCVTCGATRMFMHMFEGNFKAAFHDNPLMFIIWPYGAWEVLYVVYTYYAKKEIPRLNYVVLWVVIVICIGFAIIRNVI